MDNARYGEERVQTRELEEHSEFQYIIQTLDGGMFLEGVLHLTPPNLRFRKQS